MKTLERTDVAVSRGEMPVISSGSLAVTQGSVTALVGPNGLVEPSSRQETKRARRDLLPRAPGSATLVGWRS